MQGVCGIERTCDSSLVPAPATSREGRLGFGYSSGEVTWGGTAALSHHWRDGDAVSSYIIGTTCSDQINADDSNSQKDTHGRSYDRWSHERFNFRMSDFCYVTVLTPVCFHVVVRRHLYEWKLFRTSILLMGTLIWIICWNLKENGTVHLKNYVISSSVISVVVYWRCLCRSIDFCWYTKFLLI